MFIAKVGDVGGQFYKSHDPGIGQVEWMDYTQAKSLPAQDAEAVLDWLCTHGIEAISVTIWVEIDLDTFETLPPANLDLVGRTYLQPDGKRVTVIGPCFMFPLDKVTVKCDGRRWSPSANLVRQALQEQVHIYQPEMQEA